MRKFIFIVSSLLALSAFAQTENKSIAGYDAGQDIISENYQAGQFLIYDCKEKHFTCVLKEYHDECQFKRDEELKKGSEEFSCAPLGEFPTKKSCFQRQLFLTSNAHGTRFCLPDNEKYKHIQN